VTLAFNVDRGGGGRMERRGKRHWEKGAVLWLQGGLEKRRESGIMEKIRACGYWGQEVKKWPSFRNL